MDINAAGALNAEINPNGNADGGGIWPNAGVGAVITTGKSFAYGAWAELAAAASVTSEEWITGAIVDVFYVSGGEGYMFQVGLGGAGVEVAKTGSVFRTGHQQSTAAGELIFPVWPYRPPLHVPSGNRISARASADSANARTVGMSVVYRTGLGT